MRYLFVALALTVAVPAWGQYDTPRMRRHMREQAVARLGGEPDARKLVEDYGEAAVRAVMACSPEVGRKLAAWSADPEGLSKLPRPADLLFVICTPGAGDDVARWAIAHSVQLRDIDCFEAYLGESQEIALELKPLSRVASEVRARRLAELPIDAPAAGKNWVLIAALVLTGVFAVLWVRARNAPGRMG